MIVRITERAANLNVLEILGGPALEHDVIELVTGNRQHVVGTPVRRATSLPRVSTDLAWIEPAIPQSDDHIGNTVASWLRGVIRGVRLCFLFSA
jgi:hypothetical protein